MENICASLTSFVHRSIMLCQNWNCRQKKANDSRRTSPMMITASVKSAKINFVRDSIFKMEKLSTGLSRQYLGCLTGDDGAWLFFFCSLIKPYHKFENGLQWQKQLNKEELVFLDELSRPILFGWMNAWLKEYLEHSPFSSSLLNFVVSKYIFLSTYDDNMNV